MNTVTLSQRICIIQTSTVANNGKLLLHTKYLTVSKTSSDRARLIFPQTIRFHHFRLRHFPISHSHIVIPLLSILSFLLSLDDLYSSNFVLNFDRSLHTVWKCNGRVVLCYCSVEVLSDLPLKNGALSITHTYASCAELRQRPFHTSFLFRLVYWQGGPVGTGTVRNF